MMLELILKGRNLQGRYDFLAPSPAALPFIR